MTEFQKSQLKKEEILQGLHKSQMAALLMRIQRDRNEQVQHRKRDSEKLIQRN
jgi:hypothetical protein